MKTRFNKLTAWVLTLAMLMTFIPSFTLGVRAAEETVKNIMLGTTALKGGQASNVYFGTYQQTSLGNEQPTTGTEGVDWIKNETATKNSQGAYYSKDPIKWRVLSKSNGKAFLLSDKNLDVVRYHEDYEAVTWETSTIRSWLNGYGAASNQNSVDYTSNNFINAAFGAAEKGVIADTTVVNANNPTYGTSGGNNTTDKVFLLSIAEATNTSYFADNNSRIATNTAYVAGGGRNGAGGMSGVDKADGWWLRSSGGKNDYAVPVRDAGIVPTTGGAKVSSLYAVRPAFNLNLSSVLFTSAAVDGKAVNVGTLSAPTDYTGNEYKLTIKDSGRSSFSVSETEVSGTAGGKVTLTYSEAQTGDNEYISAMIVDSSDNLLYYGQLANNSASGTAELTIPADLEFGTYTIKVFNEQINDDYMTDYASDFVDISLTVPKITFYENIGDTTAYDVVAKGGAMPAKPTKDGYVFNGWFTVDGKQLTSTANITEDVTVYAKFTKKSTLTTDTGIFEGGQGSYVYFGTYQQSSLGDTEPTDGAEGVDWIKSDTAAQNSQGAYYSKDPIKWRVLSNADGKAFLLSDKNLDVVQYHTEDEEVTWETSTIRSWLNGYAATSNQNSVDYSNDNFINAAFSTAEKGVIADTSVINATYDGTSETNPNPSYSTSGGNDTTDKVFLLSIAEATNTSYFADNNSRIATNTAYVAGGGKNGTRGMYGVGQADYWWLRSPGYNTENAAAVDENGDGYYSGRKAHHISIAVRPAFNLNLSSVLFTSAAEGGKAVNVGTLSAPSEYTDNEYTLTIKDENRSSFSVSETEVSGAAGGKVTLTYSGAKTGNNEYVSAMIVDSSDNLLYYGQLAQPTEESGTAELTIPAELGLGTYTIKVFNEQLNGDYMTDYASDFVDVALTVRKPQVTFYENIGDSESCAVVATGESMPTSPTKDGYAFSGWFTEDGTQLTSTANITEDVTVYAKFTKKSTLATDTGIFEGGQGSYIYFGTYQQSSLGSTKPTEGTEGVDWINSTTAVNNSQGAYYSKDPIKWRVLSNADGKAFLLSDKNLDVVQYHTENDEVTWETSTIRSWLNGYGATSNQNSVDYSNDNFINAAFSENEKNEIATTDVINATYDGTSGTNPNPSYATSGGNNTTDKVFLLSIAEAQNTSYFANDNSREAVNTAYVAGGGKIGTIGLCGDGVADWWWLRSPGRNTEIAANVYPHGDVYEYGIYVYHDSSAVRPAFNLNLNSVLFTSAAEGGKGDAGYKLGDFVSVNDYSGNEYKLTLEDSNISAPTVSIDKNSKYQNEKMTVTYTASALENGYLSAVIENEDGEIAAYLRIADISQAATNAAATITVPKDFAAGNYTIKFFAEQYNGDYKTDLASEFTTGANIEIKEAKPVTFDVSGTEFIYKDGESRNVTVTPSVDGYTDYKVSYYKVYENNNVLYKTTPEDKAIEVGKYLYVIETTNPEYYIDGEEFTVTDTTLPDISAYANIGYMYIKTGITGQQTPIYFKDGTVNLKVGGEFTNELTNDNGTTPTYTSSNEAVATVDESGKVTAKGKGTATITAKSEKEETTPVYASYTVNVGLATVTLKAEHFTVTAKDKTYDGTTDVVISAVLNDGVAYEGDNIKVDITGVFTSADVAETGKNTVNYTITGISGTGAENYVLENGIIESTTTANITKATVTIICATTTTRTFDGTPQSVDVSAMANGAVFDSSNYTVLYNGVAATDEEGKEYPSAVGPYAVTVELTEEAAKNYTVTQPSATLIIKSASQEVFSIEGVPEAVYYGDSFTLSTDGANGTVTYTITSGAEIATINGADVTVTGVGKVTITATSEKDGYIDKYATKTFNAKQRVLTPTATATGRPYNGENGVEVTISLKNVLDDDKEKVSATGTGTMLNADAGENKIVYVSGITLDGANKDLYTLETSSVQTTVNIAKIRIENITVSASDKKYGEATTAVVTDIEEVITADKGQVEVIGTAAFEDENVAFDDDKNVIEKAVTFTATGLAGSKAANYYIDGLTAETTATISPVKVNFVVGQTTFVYDESNKEITLSASDEFGRIFNEYTVEYNETPNAAGTYTAIIKFNDENGNYTTTQGDITVTIEEATQDNLVIVGLPGTIQYGDSFTLEAVGGEDGGTYEWTVENGADVTLSATDTAETTVTIGNVVGQKVEIVVKKSTANYDDISAKVVFVPTAKVVTFDISELEQTYDGNEKEVEVNTETGVTYDVKYNNSADLPLDAGTYTVKVTANGNYSGMQTATLTIKKATATGTITGINASYTYGEAITGVNVTDLKDNTSAEITYAGTGIYVPQDTAPAKVGNYTVIATITGTNYETLTLTENFVIEKKELTVKAKDTERAYGEANPIFELVYDGFITGEDENVLLAEPIATVNANASSGVDDYEIKVSGGSAENYKFKYDNTGKLTVTSATGGSLYITGSTNTAYVNDVFTLHAFYGNSKVNVTWESDNANIAEIAENGTVTAKSAGTVTITATADDNYGNATATFNLTVKQTGITLVPTELVKTYTGERQDISFVANADFTPVLSGEGKNVDVTYTLISNPSVTEPIQAGTYSVVYTISDGSYTGGGNTTMYINKATVTAKVIDDNKVYGDEYTGYDLKITNNGGLAESVQASTLEELKGLTTFTSEGAAKTAVVKDGGYEITPTLSKSETDNVIFTVEKGTLTVTKAPLTVKVKDVSREYGAENPTLEAEYEGFKNEETENTENIFTGELALAYDESINAETTVGVYENKTTASGIEAANYDITFVPGKVTVTKIPVTASAGTSRSSYLTVKFDKAVEGVTFTVTDGTNLVEITEVTASSDNKTYTLKGSFSTSVTYTVTPALTSETHEITSEALSIKPSSSGGGGGGGGGSSAATTYTVKFETNGGNEIESVKVTKNATVTEPTAPTKDGYTFDGWYTDKELTTAYSFDTKVTKAITLYAKWTENKVDDTDDKTDDKADTPDTPVWENPFTDVNADDWYYENVEYAVENGLFNVTTETTFAPNGIITRAMMVTVLYRAEGEPTVTGETTFEDVDSNAYYAKAVVWGQQNGIIKGYSETVFAPDQNITREQIAAIMHRYAEYKGYDITQGGMAIREYDDYETISSWAMEAMQWAVNTKLITGKTATTVNPLDNATRAEIAAILNRFIEANK